MLSGTLFSRTLPFLVGSPSFFCVVDQWSHRISKGRFWNRLFSMALEWWAGGQVLGGCYSTEDTRSPVTLPQEKARNWTSSWVGFCEAYFKKTCWFLAPRCCNSPVSFFRKCSLILRRQSWRTQLAVYLPQAAACTEVWEKHHTPMSLQKAIIMG